MDLTSYIVCNTDKLSLSLHVHDLGIWCYLYWIKCAIMIKYQSLHYYTWIKFYEVYMKNIFSIKSKFSRTLGMQFNSRQAGRAWEWQVVFRAIYSVAGLDEDYRVWKVVYNIILSQKLCITLFSVKSCV